MRRLLFVVCLACGSQRAPTQTQTQTPTPSQTQPPTPTPSQSQTLAPTATPTPTACKTNDDCAMSNARACCSPCGLPPFADLKSEVDARTRRCAEVECAMRDPQECKPTESIDAYHAECQNASADPAKPGRRDDKACVAVRNPPQTPTAPAALASTETCARDGDCVVSNFGSCCSSCQASAYATSKRALEARNRRCAIVDCAMDGEPRCLPVVDASLYRAVCRAGTCAGVKR